jgi:hypothetical protein
MSWSACFFLVKPAIKNPMKIINIDTYLLKYLPVALMNEMRSPSKSVTMMPNAALPGVACIDELSKMAK